MKKEELLQIRFFASFLAPASFCVPSQIWHRMVWRRRAPREIKVLLHRRNRSFPSGQELPLGPQGFCLILTEIPLGESVLRAPHQRAESIWGLPYWALQQQKIGRSRCLPGASTSLSAQHSSGRSPSWHTWATPLWMGLDVQKGHCSLILVHKHHCVAMGLLFSLLLLDYCVYTHTNIETRQ